MPVIYRKNPTSTGSRTHARTPAVAVPESANARTRALAHHTVRLKLMVVLSDSLLHNMERKDIMSNTKSRQYLYFRHGTQEIL
jgi:hypothetical protein